MLQFQIYVEIWVLSRMSCLYILFQFFHLVLLIFVYILEFFSIVNKLCYLLELLFLLKQGFNFLYEDKLFVLVNCKSDNFLLISSVYSVGYCSRCLVWYKICCYKPQDRQIQCWCCWWRCRSWVDKEMQARGCCSWWLNLYLWWFTWW